MDLPSVAGGFIAVGTGESLRSGLSPRIQATPNPRACAVKGQALNSTGTADESTSTLWLR